MEKEGIIWQRQEADEVERRLWRHGGKVGLRNGQHEQIRTILQERLDITLIVLTQERVGSQFLSLVPLPGALRGTLRGAEL